MLTSSNYNYEFSNAIRNKRRNEEILSEGYDKSSDSYMFPSCSFDNFSDVVIKENLFRRLGTVLHAPTREGLIQTVFSTANAAIVGEAKPISPFAMVILPFRTKFKLRRRICI